MQITLDMIKNFMHYLLLLFIFLFAFFIFLNHKLYNKVFFTLSIFYKIFYRFLRGNRFYYCSVQQYGSYNA